MRILHCCLAAFYIDNFGYQENILPKMHKMAGHDVRILASTETYSKDMKITYLKPSSYTSEHGIPVIRVPYVTWLPHFIVKKIRLYKHIENVLDEFKPDVIFMHDCQTLSVKSFVRYAKERKVKIYVDCHTDFINSGRGWLSKNILHKIIYKYCVKVIEKYVDRFYGTLPLRCDFLHDVYNVEKSKIELLPFGVDDSLIDLNKKSTIRQMVRGKLGLSENDFVIVTGGKLDMRKNIHLLLKAVSELSKVESSLKLILFGKPTEETAQLINPYLSNSSIRYMEWLSSTEISDYFCSADLGYFPGTHSVLWEQAIGTGLPCVYKSWEGIQHLDVGGNCLFISDVTADNIKNSIFDLIRNQQKFRELKQNAEKLGPEFFAYSKIASRSIEQFKD